jgi:dihydroorotate dehydrogenase (fumarate)
MSDLSTEYMGLKLENPIVVASCSLSKNIDGIQNLADSGAGAIVLKSLFEEQIQKEMVEDVEQYISHAWHSEAYDYVNKMGMELGPREYLKLIENAKKEISIPIIASLNCVSSGWWKDYAKQIENAGADAVELNVSYTPVDVKKTANDIEQTYFGVIDRVRESIDIPISVKIGPYFSSIPYLTYELCRRGASAVVLFNRFYQFNIDSDKMRVVSANHLSSSSEMFLPLKWIAMLYGLINCDLAATTGIHDSESAVKMILAGAQVVQVCSILYKKGVQYLGNLRTGMEKWMNNRNIGSFEDIRGKMSRQESEKPELYERLQYIKALVGIE